MRVPLVAEASTITVPSVIPDITALRIGKLRRVGGESGQNWETSAHSRVIRCASPMFCGG
jgi:hypothetical protein